MYFLLSAALQKKLLQFIGKMLNYGSASFAKVQNKVRTQSIESAGKCLVANILEFPSTTTGCAARCPWC